jgi:hypothetical protein
VTGETRMLLRQETLGQLKRQVDQLVAKCGQDARIVFRDDWLSPIKWIHIDCTWEEEDG